MQPIQPPVKKPGLASPKTVDAVAFDPKEQVYRLILELDVVLDGSRAQALALQEKLNTYVGFALEEMGDRYPGSEGKDVVIRVVAREAPQGKGAALLEKFKAAIVEQGLGFEVDVVAR